MFLSVIVAPVRAGRVDVDVAGGAISTFLGWNRNHFFRCTVTAS
jgi:hypothetical protein